MQHNKFFILLLFAILLPSVFSAVLPTPSSWDESLHPGGVATKVFNFEQTSSNITTSISFSKTGSNSDWISTNISTGSISNINDTQENLSMKATITVPSTAPIGVSLIKIKYDSSEIPVVVTVQENATIVSVGKCRLEPFPDSYTIPFVTNSPPLTQTFSILVSRHCTEEVNIKTPSITGNTQTNDGLKPLNLIGGSKLGFTEPNDEGTFDVQIDIKNLPVGTYKPQIQIVGIYKGEQISTKIFFTVEVKQGASPLESNSLLPTYIFSASDLALNNTYTITAQNLNPNFQPFVEQNDFIRGIKVDISNGWTYSFQPNKIGTTKLRISTYFAGAPIGDITEKEFRISYGSATSFGTRMCFQIFTPGNKALDSLSNGDALTFLVRSSNDNNPICTSNNTENTIINSADIYKNGVKMTSNTLTVNAGEIVTLSASAPGFISIDKVLDVPLDPIGVSFQSPNDEVEAGIPLLILTTPEATVTINGQEVSKNHTFPAEGTYSLVASKSGYKQTAFEVIATPQLKLVSTEIPKKIKLEETYHVEYNKPARWRVMYSENKKNATEFLYKEGFSNVIEFVPDRDGIYNVYSRNDLINKYKIGGLFGLTIPKWFWYGLGGIIVLFFIIKIFSSKGSSSESGGSGAKYDFNVDEFEK